MGIITKHKDFQLDQFIKTLDNIFVKKAPALPESAKEWIVKFGPWITLVIVVLLLPVVIGAFGVSLFFAPIAAAVRPELTAFFWLGWLFAAVSLALEIFALPGLFNRKKQGWTLLLYATLLNAVYNIVNFNLFGLIIGTGLSLYILMQIRSKYA